MVEYGITALQTKPRLFKEMSISKIVDKRDNCRYRIFIPAKYADLISDVINKLNIKRT